MKDATTILAGMTNDSEYSIPLIWTNNPLVPRAPNWR